MANDVKANMEHDMRGRTPEQQTAIRYFYNVKGCMQKGVSDEEYDALVKAKVEKINFKKKALKKIGLDESEVSEIEPVVFAGPLFDNTNKKLKIRLGANNLYRSSIFQVSYIFFTSNRVCAYQYTFSMIDDETVEHTEDYFYKDITNFSTTTEQEEFSVTSDTGGCFGQQMFERRMIGTNKFYLCSAGGQFYCSIAQNAYTDRAIQGMKAKLVEKKNE